MHYQFAFLSPKHEYPIFVFVKLHKENYSSAVNPLNTSIIPLVFLANLANMSRNETKINKLLSHHLGATEEIFLLQSPSESISFKF